MNKAPLLIALGFMVSAGCSLLPRQVEHLQSKVKAVPAKTPEHVQAEKQAVAYIAAKTDQTLDAALAEQCSTNVTMPAAEANTAAEALVRSIGPPAKPWIDSADALAMRLDRMEAKLDAKLDAYRASVAPNVGKKIEGTGLIKIGFFTQWGLILAAAALVWAGFKAYGLFNPVVGIGMNVAGRVSSRLLHAGFGQMAAAGERFKGYVETSPLSAEDKDAVYDLFRRAHMETQSPEVQKIIAALTK